MLKQLFLLLAGATTGAACVLYILTLPLLGRLPEEGCVALDGVLTIADAIAACRKSGLGGGELVAYAQKLAARKFTYSRLNPWDTPARAFARGRGYCQQQALALKKIYDGLGIQARPVFATRCSLFPRWERAKRYGCWNDGPVRERPGAYFLREHRFPLS